MFVHMIKYQKTPEIPEALEATPTPIAATIDANMEKRIQEILSD